MPSTSTFFFFNDTATTEIYTLSLHDALPIFAAGRWAADPSSPDDGWCRACEGTPHGTDPCCSPRSEEHTSELQSHLNLVCRLLLEKKNNQSRTRTSWRNEMIPTAILNLTHRL